MTAADETIRFDLTLTKRDDDRRLVYGWGSVVAKADGQLAADTQGDVIDTPDAVTAWEDAWHDYVATSRSADDMHTDFGVAELVECCVFSPEKLAKMGLAPINGDTPTVAAWVGFRIPRDDRGDRLWADIKSGQRTQLSIVGTGSREVLL